MTVKPEMLSDYSREILEREGMTIGKVQKLIPNLMDKEKYVLHYRNLQLYLSLGLKLKKNSSCPGIFSKQLVGTLYCF